MTRWFRVHNELIDEPKIQRREPALFETLESANHGALPPFDEIAFKLRLKPQNVQRVLHAAGLIDDDQRGARPHNWDDRQFSTDTSTARVRGPGEVRHDP